MEVLMNILSGILALIVTGFCLHLHWKWWARAWIKGLTRHDFAKWLRAKHPNGFVYDGGEIVPLPNNTQRADDAQEGR